MCVSASVSATPPASKPAKTLLFYTGANIALQFQLASQCLNVFAGLHSFDDLAFEILRCDDATLFSSPFLPSPLNAECVYSPCLILGVHSSPRSRPFSRPARDEDCRAWIRAPRSLWTSRADRSRAHRDRPRHVHKSFGSLVRARLFRLPYAWPAGVPARPWRIVPRDCGAITR